MLTVLGGFAVFVAALMVVGVAASENVIHPALEFIAIFGGGGAVAGFLGALGVAVSVSAAKSALNRRRK